MDGQGQRRPGRGRGELHERPATDASRQRHPGPSPGGLCEPDRRGVDLGVGAEVGQRHGRKRDLPGPGLRDALAHSALPNLPVPGDHSLLDLDPGPQLVGEPDRISGDQLVQVLQLIRRREVPAADPQIGNQPSDALHRVQGNPGNRRHRGLDPCHEALPLGRRSDSRLAYQALAVTAIPSPTERCLRRLEPGADIAVTQSDKFEPAAPSTNPAEAAAALVNSRWPSALTGWLLFVEAAPAAQAEPAQGRIDLVVLGHGETHRVDRSARNDRPLERSVAVPERRVGPQASRKPRMAATSGSSSAPHGRGPDSRPTHGAGHPTASAGWAGRPRGPGAGSQDRTGPG
jgi:hypothetical protein